MRNALLIAIIFHTEMAIPKGFKLDFETLHMLEITRDYQVKSLVNITTDDQAIDLIENFKGGDRQLLYSQLKLIDSGIVEKLETIRDVNNQIAELYQTAE